MQLSGLLFNHFLNERNWLNHIVAIDDSSYDFLKIFL